MSNITISYEYWEADPRFPKYGQARWVKRTETVSEEGIIAIALTPAPKNEIPE
jgi:hypothetical protein